MNDNHDPSPAAANVNQLHRLVNEERERGGLDAVLAALDLHSKATDLPAYVRAEAKAMYINEMEKAFK